MADSFIQLPGDSTGKQLDTALVNMGVGTTAVHREKVVIADPLSTSAFATVTSSAGLLASLSSGTVTLSSQITVLSASSGLVQISGIPTIAVSSSALAAINVVTSSGAYVPVTTGSGLLVQATGPTSISGTVTVLSASSGLIQISGIPTVIVATSAGLTQTVTIVSASSGLIQISGIPTVIVASSAGLTQTLSVGVTTSGLSPEQVVTSSGGSLVATTSQGLMVQQSTSKIVPVLAASSGTVSIDLWQGTSRVAPTFVIATTISAISSNPGSLWLLTGFTTSTGGIGATIPGLLRLYNVSTSNVSMGSTSAVCILPLGMQSSSTSVTGGGDVATPLSLINFSPIGMGFATACSFDIVQTATSTAAVAGSAYVTALYSTV